MPRAPATFKQCDVVRLMKAARRAEFEVGHIEVGPDGSIRLFPKGSAAIEPADAALEAWKAKRDARPA